MKLPDGQYTSEDELMVAVKTWLDSQRRYGVRYARIVDRYTRGYSDIFVNACGRLVLIELKDNTGTASPHQEEFLKDMIAGGAYGGICRTVDQVKELVCSAMYCTCDNSQGADKYCSVCGKIIR